MAWVHVSYEVCSGVAVYTSSKMPSTKYMPNMEHIPNCLSL